MSTAERWIDIDVAFYSHSTATVTLWERMGTYGKNAIRSIKLGEGQRTFEIVAAVFTLRKIAPGCRIECDIRGPGVALIQELHREFDRR